MDDANEMTAEETAYEVELAAKVAVRRRIAGLFTHARRTAGFARRYRREGDSVTDRRVVECLDAIRSTRHAIRALRAAVVAS